MSTRFFCLFIFIIFSFNAVYAGDTISIGSKDTMSSVAPDSSKERDLIELIAGAWHRYHHSEYKPKPRQFHWAVIPAAGYTLQTGFAGIISADVGFYTGSDQSKVSNILTSFTYSQYNQTIIPLQADIWSKNNKYDFILDWRYIDYPCTTFGIGGHTDFTDGYTIDFSSYKIHQSILRSISPNFYAGVGYYFDYFWDISEINPPAGVVTSFQKYGLSSTEIASGVALRLLYDSRMNQINPQQGYFANMVYRPNFTFMGSQNNWQSLQIDLRKYIRFPAGSRNVLAFWSFDWLTLAGKPPYLLLPSTGWDDQYNSGRGYIQGRYRAKNMIYLESEYRFVVSRNGLIGGVVFANAETFTKNVATDNVTSEYKDIAPGFGGGIRIKLNKHTGANLCVDYGIGLDGSRGFFVNLGEVF